MEGSKDGWNDGKTDTSGYHWGSNKQKAINKLKH